MQLGIKRERADAAIANEVAARSLLAPDLTTSPGAVAEEAPPLPPVEPFSALPAQVAPLQTIEPLPPQEVAPPEPKKEETNIKAQPAPQPSAPAQEGPPRSNDPKLPKSFRGKTVEEFEKELEVSRLAPSTLKKAQKYLDEVLRPAHQAYHAAGEVLSNAEPEVPTASQSAPSQEAPTTGLQFFDEAERDPSLEAGTRFLGVDDQGQVTAWLTKRGKNWEATISLGMRHASHRDQRTEIFDSREKAEAWMQNLWKTERVSAEQPLKTPAPAKQAEKTAPPSKPKAKPEAETDAAYGQRIMYYPQSG